MILAEVYRARHATPFEAYMALQCALLRHYLLRGGTQERWCSDMAPRFRARYSTFFT